MPDSAALYLPLNSWINVRSFTNSAFNQQVTVVEENGTRHQYQGSGEHDTPMPGGDFHIQTPGAASNPLGYKVTITIENYHDGKWNPSSVLQGSSGVMYYYLSMVVSEDYVDNDWNDAVVQFTWWLPPPAR